MCDWWQENMDSILVVHIQVSWEKYKDCGSDMLETLFKYGAVPLTSAANNMEMWGSSLGRGLLGDQSIGGS